MRFLFAQVQFFVAQMPGSALGMHGTGMLRKAIRQASSLRHFGAERQARPEVRLTLHTGAIRETMR